MDIQILKVNDNKSCVKFSYKDPQTKVDININDNAAVFNHFRNIRDDDKLRMFNDTTYDEAQEAQ